MTAQRWQGWWEQASLGRQPMDELWLEFADGQVSGQGEDCVGPFTLAGSYDAAGRLRLVKQYRDKHAVEYAGQSTGEGVIAGRWTIAGVWSGPFALWPARAASGGPIRAL